MTLAALDTRLKFTDFSGLLFILGPNYNNSKISETDCRGPETEIGGLEPELRVFGIHDTLDYRITGCPSQPDGPSRGGAGGFIWKCTKMALLIVKAIRVLFWSSLAVPFFKQLKKD